MNNIDKWCAKQCGVETTSQVVGQGHETRIIELWQGSEWTIEDPRCREIVRERFGIQLVCHADLKTWIAFTRNQEQSGKTIAEAEIMCITAIWEARDE